MICKELRWNIYSFITNDHFSLYKENYNNVIKELTLKNYYKEFVLIRIKKDTFPVVEDIFGKCINCYRACAYSGMNPNMRFGIKVCDFHAFEDTHATSIAYMSFYEFSDRSNFF